jgi:hypothetical protein
MVTGVPGPCVGNIAPIPRIDFGGLCLQDGPLAIRQADYASVFPAGLSATASWDLGLIYQRGMDLGSEFKGKGANIALGSVLLLHSQYVSDILLVLLLGRWARTLWEVEIGRVSRQTHISRAPLSL